jgi:squalene synthase HpnD
VTARPASGMVTGNAMSELPRSSLPPNEPPAAALAPAEIARRSRSNFLAAFVFLGPERRRGLEAIYAFCRAVDDAADDARDAAEAEAWLGFWEAELVAAVAGHPATPTGRAIADAIQRFGVDPEHLRAVVRGVRMDAMPLTFQTLDELDAYCHLVASAVGLACLPVFGARGAEADRYARELGLALQLTNVLRDIAEDARIGRVYLPQDALGRHGVDPAWLDGRGPASAYASRGPIDALVQELAAVAAARFAAAAAALPPGQERALRPAEAMSAVYSRLLVLVRRRGGRIDVGGRLRVPKWRKVAALLRTWWRAA